jgi:hypothetical protein
MKTHNLLLKSANLALIAFLLLVSPLSASGKKKGSFYCNAAKTTYPITKADIRSTATGFSLAVKSAAWGRNLMIFEIGKNLEIQKYGFPKEITAWQEVSSRKPDFNIKNNGSIDIDFFVNGCGGSSINGMVEFIGNAKSRIFTR